MAAQSRILPEAGAAADPLETLHPRRARGRRSALKVLRNPLVFIGRGERQPSRETKTPPYCSQLPPAPISGSPHVHRLRDA